LLVDEQLVASGKLDIRPAYPAEAQAQRLTGSGVFVLHVDARSGLVSSVEIQRSTGHKILDDASVASFSQLRFRPHGVQRVTIPISFEMPADNSGPRVTRNFPATWLAESQRLHTNTGRSLGRR